MSTFALDMFFAAVCGGLVASFIFLCGSSSNAETESRLDAIGRDLMRQHLYSTALDAKAERLEKELNEEKTATSRSRDNLIRVDMGKCRDYWILSDRIDKLEKQMKHAPALANRLEVLEQLKKLAPDPTHQE